MSFMREKGVSRPLPAAFRVVVGLPWGVPLPLAALRCPVVSAPSVAGRDRAVV